MGVGYGLVGPLGALVGGGLAKLWHPGSLLASMAPPVATGNHRLLVIGTDQVSGNTDSLFTLHLYGGKTELTQVPRDTYIESDQYDARVDHVFNSQHSLWARFNTKANPQLSGNNLTLPSDTVQAKYYQGSAAWTWTIKPTLLNEFRYGNVTSDETTVFPFDGLAFTNSLNLKDIQRDIFFNGLPNFGVTNYTGVSKGRPGFGISANNQFIDNLTWIILAGALLGFVLRAVLGRIPGSVMTAGIVGTVSWFLLGALTWALIAGGITLLTTWVGIAGLLRARYGGRGGPGGGFKGGGGGFGGGGASGRW
jgi:hypothetical protein